jgi:predicted GTPase
MALKSADRTQNDLIDVSYEGLRSEMALVLKDLHALISATNKPDLEEIVSDIRVSFSEPFLFVVVGEIKAGKSSFINALLKAQICKVDPAPCTDIIQQIVYAPDETETDINPYFKRLGRPVEILKKIAIVDTPGTNTVAEHHQEITSRFIPNSGLIFFVFPAKNPHTRSAWDFLDFVRGEWRRRVVFVLQQADLATETELEVNRKKVIEYAAERGIDSPKLFVTSAIWEAAEDTRSGFEEIRAFIRETVTGGRHLYLKLDAVIDSAEELLHKVYLTLEQLTQQVKADQLMTATIDGRFEKGQAQIERDVRYLVDRLLVQYDRIAHEIRTEVEDGFSFFPLLKRGMGSIFKRQKPFGTWLEDLQKSFEGRLKTAFEDVTVEGSTHIMTTLRELADGIMTELRGADEQAADTIGVLIDFGAKRKETIDDIRDKVEHLSATEFAAETMATDPGRMPAQLFGGSALTVIGTVFLIIHSTILDITGGILAGLGILMAGGVLLVKRGKILRDFEKAIAQGRHQFEEQLLLKLSAKFELLAKSLRRSVAPFYDQVAQREKKLGPLTNQGESLQKKLINLGQKIKDLKVD